MVALSNNDLVYGALVSGITVLYTIYVLGAELPSTKGDVVASAVMMGVYLVPPLAAKFSTKFFSAILEAGQITVSDSLTEGGSSD